MTKPTNARNENAPKARPGPAEEPQIAATRVLYGLTDVLVPRQHGEWLGRNVPNAEVVIYEQGGHLPDPNLVTERFGWLVQPV